jgi:hypothetical protein
MKITNRKRVRNLYPMSMGLRYSAHTLFKEFVGAGRTMLLNGREVYFTADRALDVGMEVSASVEWPVVLENTVLLQLVVEGEIVRTEGKWTKMTIRRYHFRTRGLGKSIRPLPWPEAKPQPLVACAVAS